MPTRFGKYTLHEKIGAGGMAEVFRATVEGAGGFEKQVALKRILVPHARDPDFVNMFIDEARIAVALSHPNVAQIFEFDEVDDVYYIAMEYVEGHNLSELIKHVRRREILIPTELILHIGGEVCRGLDAAHSATDGDGRPLGIIHRDISPQNVQISHGGDVKILDFGVAKAHDKLVQTEAGTIRGKLLYMAPEQVRAKKLDHRVDIFSLGLVLYKALTGIHPFEADTDVEVVNKLRKCEIEPPTQLLEALPAEIDGVLMRALAFKPADRYQDAATMHDDLTRVLRAHDPDFSWAALRTYMQQVRAEIAEDTEERKRKFEAALRLPATMALSNQSASSAEWDQEDEIATETPLSPLAISSPSPLVAATPVSSLIADSPPRSPRLGGRGRIAVGALALVGLVIGWASLGPGPEPGPEAEEERGVAGQPAAGRFGILTVESVPPGAEILLDGEALASERGRPLVTPAEVPLVPVGSHRVRLDIPGYVSWDGDVEVTADAPAKIHKTLSMTPGTLVVTTVPSGAIITLDGEELGASPTRLAWIDRAREHVLGITLEGHAAVEKRLVFEGELLEERVTLTRAAPRRAPAATPVPRPPGAKPAPAPRAAKGAKRFGYVSLNSIPWAKIYIDGQDTGRTTPARNLKLAPGRRTVRLVNPHKRYSKTLVLTVKPGETLRRSVDFRRDP
jgi:serine/threonine protein kinase